MFINRIIYLILLVASFVFSSFYGGYAPSVMRYFLILVPLLSLTYTTLVYVRLKFHQELSADSVLRGGIIRYKYKIKNCDLIPYMDIRLIFSDTLAHVNGSEDMCLTSIMPCKTVNCVTTISCKYIGVYNVGITGMIIYDFFHLFRIHYRCRKPVKVRVKPLRLNPPYIAPYITMNENKNTYGQCSSSQDTLGCSVRAYAPGDSIRMIHWKNSARSHELVTRQFENMIEEKTAVIVDTNLSGLPFENRVIVGDSILQTMIAIADYFIRHNLGMTVYYSVRTSISAVPVVSEKDFRVLNDMCPDLNMCMRGRYSDTVDRVAAEINGACGNMVLICFRPGQNVYKSVKRCLQKEIQVTVINVTVFDSSGTTYSVFDEEKNPLLHVLRLGIDDDICEVLS